MGSKQSNINEVIGFLTISDPAALKELRTQFPDYADILAQGITLGSENALYADPNEALVRGLACKAGLESVLKKCGELMPSLKKRLKSLGNLQLSSQVVIAISGASLLTQLGQNMPAFTAAAGGLTLVGSLLTLFVQHKSGTLLNNSQSIFHFYDKLVDNRFEAEQQLLEIDLALQAYSESNPDRLVTVVNKSNQICLDIRKIMEKL